mgnify:CR=1 FL=1|jgi:hypothetical protein|tara:strand:- start:377 stop:649 length:273 start_codon:yes stop_codon:yes gene_type:complete
MDKLFKYFPNEISIKIYKYINPISKAESISRRYWCFNCGEYIDEGSVCIELPVKQNNITTLATLHQRFIHDPSKLQMQLFCLDCFNSKSI